MAVLFCLHVTIHWVVSPYGFHMAEGGNCKLAFQPSNGLCSVPRHPRARILVNRKVLSRS